MKQLTVRGFDRELERRIRRLARQENISLNKAVLRLLRRGAGLADKGQSSREIGSSLDHLAGTWTAEQAKAFDEVQQDFERIDPDLWL
ncbi:MAG: hypothetical protein ACE5JX_18040 [Acidobacteriota bacterium]